MRNMSVGPDESFVFRSVEILQRRWKVAAAVFTVVVASAISFARYLPDLYRATAVVLIERQLPETLVRSVVSDEVDTRLHVIKQEILSRTRLTELIDRFNLYPDLRARSDMDSVLEQMRRDISIEQTGPEQISGRTKTVAFNLTYTGSGRETVADVTNAIAAFYAAQNNQIRSEEAQRAVSFLKAQLDDSKQELQRNEQAVRSFTTRYVGQLPQQLEVNLATLERLNTQLRLNGERQLRILEQRERATDTVTTAPIAARANAPLPASIRLERLERELADLRGNATDNHPDVRRLKDDIRALEQETQAGSRTIETSSATAGPVQGPGASRSTARAADGLDAELQRLKADEATLRQSVASVERRLEGLPYRQNEFALISRDHQAAKDLYDSLLKRYEEAQLATSMETANRGERFRLLEQAVSPLGPSAPNRPRLLVMGLLVAILLAGVAMLLLEQFDTSFHTVDDVRAFTTVPVLVTIPRIAGAPAAGISGALAAGALLGALGLIATLSAYVATGNEPLVRMLFHTV
jgi:polysaccharide biosynthesis transport protein